MEIQEKLDALRRIVNTKASALTPDDRAFVLELAQENGVEVRRKGCGSCIIEAAVQIFGMLSKEPEQDAAEDERKYVLKDGVRVLFNGILICEATLTDRLAAAIVEQGFSVDYFAKYPEQ